MNTSTRRFSTGVDGRRTSTNARPLVDTLRSDSPTTTQSAKRCLTELVESVNGPRKGSRAKRHPRDNDKAQRDFHLNRTEKLASRARRTDNALARLENVQKPWEGWQLRFTINEAPRSGAVVVRLEHAVVAVSYT